MKTTIRYIGILIVLGVQSIHAQDTSNVYSFNFNNLRPIVQVFGSADYYFEDSRYGYSFGRAHLGFEYRFNDKWSSKIVIDRGRPTTFDDIYVTDSAGNQLGVNWSVSEGAYYTMYLKFASLRWKVNDRLILEGGAILQNSFITQERFWGLRYVAKTFQDLYWRIPSSDLGFIAYYRFNDHFSFDVALTNGEGPRVRQDDFGKIKIAGGININPGKILYTRFFYHLRQTYNEAVHGNEQLGSVFIGVKPYDRLRIGGELNYVNCFQGVSELESYGFSFYVIYRVFNKTELFARFDRLLYNLPSGYVSSTLNNGNTLMTGASYTPVKGVSLSLNYQAWFPDQEDAKIKSGIALSMEYKF